MQSDKSRPVEKAGINLKRLRYFIAVCEHGGFSRASTSIGVAQPALTRQVKLLEKEIGLSLITRTGRGAEPTDQGRFLLDRSRRHLDELDGLVRELKYRSSGLGGDFVLGACPTIAPFFVSRLSAEVRENHPGLSLSVIEAYSGDLQNLMKRRELDLALTYQSSASKGMEVTELFSERLVLVTAPGDGVGGDGRTLAEISRMKLVLPSGIHELRRIIDAVSRRRGLPLKPELELDSLDAVKSLIAGNTLPYATILPYHGVKAELDAGALSCFQIDDLDMRRTIAVVGPRKSRNLQAAEYFVGRIRNHAADLKARLDTVF